MRSQHILRTTPLDSNSQSTVEGEYFTVAAQSQFAEILRAAIFDH